MPHRTSFVDAVTGRHYIANTQQFLDQRCLVWNKQYGWTYDVSVADPVTYVLSGPQGRFSIPGIAKNVSIGLMLAAKRVLNNGSSS